MKLQKLQMAKLAEKHARKLMLLSAIETCFINGKKLYVFYSPIHLISA